MPKRSWHDIEATGQVLNKALKRLDAKLETIDDVHELNETARAMAYVGQIMIGISNSQENEAKIQELRTRLDKIEGK